MARVRCELSSYLLALLGGAGQVRKLSRCWAELFQEFKGHLLSNLVARIFAFYIDTEITATRLSLRTSLNLEILGLPARYQQAGVREVPRMVRVCCRLPAATMRCEIPRRHTGNDAPHTPWPHLLFRRDWQGPMWHILQQAPLVADGQGFSFSARSNEVSSFSVQRP